MMRSDYTSWSVAVLLSLLLHGMMFMQGGAQIGAVDAPLSQAPHITHLSFNQIVEVPVADEPLPVEKPLLQPVKKPEPRPVPVKAKVRQPERVEQSEPVKQAIVQPPVQGRQDVRPSEDLLQRQQYLHKLLSHIEAHKFYPRAARRRALEGNVRISFVLRDDGYYEQLALDGGQKLLVNAARQALETARPLPSPPADAGLSRQIELIMAYSLTD